MHLATAELKASGAPGRGCGAEQRAAYLVAWGRFRAVACSHADR